MREYFWRKYKLNELDHDEWEALCDGCALCCLRKLEDEDTGHIAVTDLSCRMLDVQTCRCIDYKNRHDSVPDCVSLDAHSAQRYTWLPETCAYRRLAANKPLPYWHWLESGDKNLVHRLEVSARFQSRCETTVPEHLWQERVVRWVKN